MMSFFCTALIGLCAFCSWVRADGNWVGTLDDMERLVMMDLGSGNSHIPAETPGPLENFQVSKNGDYAVALAVGTNLLHNAQVKSHHGPQLYLYDRQLGTWTLLSKDPSTHTPLGARGPLFISANGELIYFETGPVFPRIGSLSEQLKGYFGPVCYDRAQNVFRAVSGAIPTGEEVTALNTTSVIRLLNSTGKALVVSNDVELGALLENEFSLILHHTRTDEATYLGESDNDTALLGYDFYKTELAGFTPEELLDPDISGPTANPDGDGLINHTEFLLNTPLLSYTKLPLHFVSTDQGEMEMVFPLSTFARPGDLDLIVTHSLLDAPTAIDASLLEDWQARSGDGSVVWKRYPIDLSEVNTIFFGLRDNSP